MGGTTQDDTNAAYQLLLLCGTGTAGCHGEVEQFRRMAYRRGWLVRHPLNPADVPVTIVAFSAQVLLTADGEYQEVAS